jgi:hypothetical protein
MELNIYMSSSIIQCIKSVIGEDVNIDTFQKGTMTFYNATSLWKRLGSNPRHNVASFLKLHRTRDHIISAYDRVANKCQTIEKVSLASYSLKKPVPTEILDVFVMSGLNKDSAIYLEENLFTLYSKRISTDIEIAIINTYIKYMENGLVPFISTTEETKH